MVVPLYMYVFVNVFMCSWHSIRFAGHRSIPSTLGGLTCPAPTSAHYVAIDYNTVPGNYM